MTISFSTVSPTFRAKISKNDNKCEHHHVCPDCGEVISCNNAPVEKKKGFFTRLKDGFIGIRKGFIDFGYIAGGTIKGGFYGSIAAGGILGAAKLRNVVKNLGPIGTGAKVLAGVTCAVVMTGNIIKSKLDANEAKAKLDHRWETGHNE